jgi:Domain of unknown function (DUF1818)
MASRSLKSGPGWRLGWNPESLSFPGLVGTDDWAIELTPAELADFWRLTLQLAETMTAMQAELMDEEALTLEAESEHLWLEACGFPSAYGLRLIVQSGRRVEGAWAAAAVPGLVAAIQSHGSLVDRVG